LYVLDKRNHRVDFVRSKAFYDRQKVHLADLRQVRTEMGVAYRACVRKQLDWADLRAAIACLSAIAALDQGLGADERLRQIEATIASIKPNGSARPELHQ
jgi:hypothetical protein